MLPMRKPPRRPWHQNGQVWRWVALVAYITIALIVTFAIYMTEKDYESSRILGAQVCGTVQVDETTDGTVRTFDVRTCPTDLPSTDMTTTTAVYTTVATTEGTEDGMDSVRRPRVDDGYTVHMVVVAG